MTKRQYISLFYFGAFFLVMGILNILLNTPRLEISLGLMGVGFILMLGGTVGWLSTPKARKRSRHIEIRVKQEVWRRDQGRCIQCGSKNKLEYDHVIPFVLGGSNTARNIQLLCQDCNRSKSKKIQ